MKRLFFFQLILAFAFAAPAFAGEGDTSFVQVHQEVDMTWYGAYDQWGEFPDTTLRYRKILLHYTMGCATGGCSDWDYTTRIEILHRTGVIDSNLILAPNFTVNGDEQDSVHFATDTTWSYFYNAATMSTDSTQNDSLFIVTFSNPDEPLEPTDTIIAWPANYYNYLYDDAGVVIDSIWVQADSSWYLNKTEVYIPFEVIEPIELARVITPYGGSLSNNWSRTYSFDVTDYAPLLRDSVELRAFYDGWSSGFSVTLDFELIEGVPPRDTRSVRNLYKGSWNYTTSFEFESTHLPEQTVFIHDNAEQVAVKVLTTGHGFDNNVNCAEFCNRDYFIEVEDEQVYTQEIWREDCGLNATFPQAGTWLYDRANWCPGDVAHTYTHELTDFVTPGDSASIDMNIEAYTWNGNQAPIYIISTQLLEFGEPNFSNDASIIEILSPSDDPNYDRFNPICSSPRVIIRNTGSDTLESLTITYGLIGGPTKTFQWEGQLGFLASEEVTLDATNSFFWETQEEQKVFQISLSNPNGVTDEYDQNNTLSTGFSFPPEYPSSFVVNFRTNNAGHESGYFVRDHEGVELYSRTGMEDNTLYKDTIVLEPGCYTFEVVDLDKDGLNFFANNDGSGYVNLRELPSGLLENFNANFGTSIIRNFTVGYLLNTSEVRAESQRLAVYPNPSKGVFEVQLEGMRNLNCRLEVFDLSGRKIKTHDVVPETNFHIHTLDMEALQNGTYILITSNQNGMHYKRMVKQ